MPATHISNNPNSRHYRRVPGFRRFFYALVGFAGLTAGALLALSGFAQGDDIAWIGVGLAVFGAYGVYLATQKYEELS